MPVAMDYLLFDATPFGFAPPRLPVMPALRLGALQWRRGAETPVPAWAASGRLYTRARYALHEAFRLSGVGQRGALLAPAYHCRTMIDPGLALDAPVQCYALSADLAPELADIARLLAGATTGGRPPVKAVLVSHFFGKPQALGALAALCRHHGAALIEDCAHALPLRQPSNHMGATGDWCVASPYKFYPCDDGGALWSATGQATTSPPLHRPGALAALRQLPHLLARRQQTLANAPRPPTGPAPTAQAAQRAQHLAVSQEGPSHDYLAQRESLACSGLSRWIIDHTDVDQMLARRRHNHQRLATAVQGLPGARALMPTLGPDDTPYMFPLLIEHPERHFEPLKRCGLPIWRWDSLARSHCPIAADYRLKLLHLPCHQSLSDDDLDWMARTLTQVLRGTTGPATGETRP